VTEQRWAEVDRYICELFVPPDPALDQALETSRAAGLPPINVAPNQGKLLHLLARLAGARRVLEVGTLGGYSTIWLARALPADGHLTTLEIDPDRADLARANLERAGLAERVTVRIGPAADTLASLAAEGAGPFDLVFIDADKPGNPEYFAWAMRLARPGSLIVVDNVVRRGAVADPDDGDLAVVGTRRLNEVMAAEQRVSVTEIQTVGSKGYDGFALALVLADGTT
jgi:predicted O-methyltransferase YrrM